jgi:RNA polymerase sigma-70 factor (ECF subfamily)
VMADSSTAALVARARAGEPKACEELVRRHLRAAFAVALAMVRSPADAEDIAQEAMAVAFERLDTCREPARFSGWLLTIVRNRARNALDHRKVRSLYAEKSVTEQADAARTASSARHEPQVGLRDRLLRALDSLTPVQREVVLLHDLDGWTHGEIAQSLEISEVSSRQHLFNGRRIMRGLVTDDVAREVSHD